MIFKRLSNYPNDIIYSYFNSLSKILLQFFKKLGHIRCDHIGYGLDHIGSRVSTHSDVQCGSANRQTSFLGTGNA